MSDTPEVEILLATYNGERYLQAQIESILAQDYSSLRILARDDGSTDSTIAILEQYAARFPDRFRMMPAGKATGHPKWNFLRLMEASTSDYVCFADQDDVWLPQKITLTMQAMKRLEARHGNKIPLLAFTDLCVVDAQLKTQHESYWKLHRMNPYQANHLTRLIGQNVVTGCTALFNRPLLKMALRMPEEAHMHDSWVALVASAFGASEPVPTQTVLYRQHDQNALGAGGSEGQMNLPQRSKHDGHRESWLLVERQAKGMLRTYHAELPANKLRPLEAFLQCRQRDQGFVRVGTVLWYGLYTPRTRSHLAMLWYLWNMKMPKHKE